MNRISEYPCIVRPSYIAVISDLLFGMHISIEAMAILMEPSCNPWNELPLMSRVPNHTITKYGGKIFDRTRRYPMNLSGRNATNLGQTAHSRVKLLLSIVVHPVFH